jgi:ParB family transcriptional regulator, chromosome partitioning protein
MAAKKNALGRGLGALIDDSNTPQARTRSVNEIRIDEIEVNPYQPRERFDEEALNELAASIKELGIIQPITVRELDNNKYQLITGERRLRASKMAGLRKIPAYIRTADDQGMLEMALVENIQREDLDSIEVAISYHRLIEECKLTQEVLSERVGKKRSTVTNYLRLLKLPPEIQVGIRNRELTMGHARALITIDDLEAQLRLYSQILTKDLSVRKVEELVRNLNKPKADKSDGVNVKTEEYQKLEEHLSNYFHSRVEFKRSTKGDGKIIIPFKSDEDLERIIGILDKLNS